MASPSTRTQVTYLVTVPTIALVAVLIGMSLRPEANAPGPTGPLASDIAHATARPTPSPAIVRPPGPNEYPDRCILPEALPRAAEPVAAPAVETEGVAMLFASYMYERTSSGTIAALDGGVFAAEFGLWFVPEGSDTARLLLESENGAMTPLALSSAGDVAVVWWLPLRGDGSADDCLGGVYLFWLESGESRLLVRGDWTRGGPGPDAVMPYDLVGRDYVMPGAMFSRDGRFVALADDSNISIFRVADGKVLARHVGACDSWAWSTARATFVAGCEGLTSAWVADLPRDDSWSVALPSPVEDPVAAEELAGLGTIGFTSDGRIRVVRFYAYPPGCDGGCQPPPPQYAVTTIDAGTTVARSRVVRTSFYAGDHAWLAPDASWVYAAGYPWESGPHVVRIGSGEVVGVRRLGHVVGSSPANERLFGRRSEEGSRRVLVMALSATGPTTQVGSIGWADGAELSRGEEIPVLGLVVVAPER
jgi:hypothetical protein